MKETVKTLDSDVVEKIDVGLASNPDNVKRVEFILTEVTKPNQNRFELVQINWLRLQPDINIIFLLEYYIFAIFYLPSGQ